MYQQATARDLAFAIRHDRPKRTGKKTAGTDLEVEMRDVVTLGVVDLIHRAKEAKKWRAVVETRKNFAVLHQTCEIY